MVLQRTTDTIRKAGHIGFKFLISDGDNDPAGRAPMGVSMMSSRRPRVEPGQPRQSLPRGEELAGTRDGLFNQRLHGAGTVENKDDFGKTGVPIRNRMARKTHAPYHRGCMIRVCREEIF